MTVRTLYLFEVTQPTRISAADTVLTGCCGKSQSSINCMQLQAPKEARTARPRMPYSDGYKSMALAVASMLNDDEEGYLVSFSFTVDTSYDSPNPRPAQDCHEDGCNTPDASFQAA